MNNEQQCRFCKKPSLPFVHVNSDVLHKCSACKSLFIFPLPTPKDMIDRHLTEKYAAHPYFTAGEEMSQDQGLPLHRTILQELTSRLPKGSHLLDVGSGAGDFISAAQPYFQVATIEASPIHAQKIREKINCPVFMGSLEDYPQPSQPFHAVTMIDLIEHLASPESALKKIHSLLQPQGLVFISTLNSESLMFRSGRLFSWLSRISKTFQHVLSRIFIYQHNLYFGRSALKKIVENAGFEVLVHEDHEIATDRLKESPLMLFGLRFFMRVQRLLGAQTEQHILCKKN